MFKLVILLKNKKKKIKVKKKERWKRSIEDAKIEIKVDNQKDRI